MKEDDVGLSVFEIQCFCTVLTGHCKLFQGKELEGLERRELKRVIHTRIELLMQVGSGSRSSFAATTRQGTSNPHLSPWAATSSSKSTAHFHDVASELS